MYDKYLFQPFSSYPTDVVCLTFLLASDVLDGLREIRKETYGKEKFKSYGLHSRVRHYI